MQDDTCHADDGAVSLQLEEADDDCQLQTAAAVAGWGQGQRSGRGCRWAEVVDPFASLKERVGPESCATSAKEALYGEDTATTLSSRSSRGNSPPGCGQQEEKEEGEGCAGVSVRQVEAQA
jgi:hypothetical protein